MTIYLPDGLQWLAWVAGTTWPEGDEDVAWAVSEAWKTASKDLAALLDDIDAAKQATIDAYPEGEGGIAMGARYDSLRTGDQSLETLAKFLGTVGDSAFDMGTEIQSTKITVIVTLAWLAIEILWAWLFPPTAAAVEQAAITTTRSFLKVFEDFVQKAITNLAKRLGAPAGVKRHFWSQAARLRPVLPTAKGWGVYGTRALEATAISGGLNAAVQVGQIAAGKRRHFNGKEFGLSILAGVAGMIPGREAGRYLGKGIDKIAANQLNNIPGRVGRGVVIGGVSGGVSTAFGNLAVGAVTGDWSSFSSGPGWVGGITRGAMVGGARGGFAIGKPIAPGHGDIRSYVWMPKPKPAAAEPSPAVNDGSSSGAGPRASVAPEPGSGASSFQTAHSTPVGSSSRPASTHSSGSSGSFVSAQSEFSGSYHSAVSSIHSGGSGSSRGSGGAPPPATSTQHPPTSWSSSVDGGWTPPASSGAGPSHAAPPAPAASSSSSSSGGAGSYTTAPTGGDAPGGGSSGNAAATDGGPFLGEGKDVRGKTRPKLWPWVEPLPGPYSPPASSGASAQQWLLPPVAAPATSVPGTKIAEQIDVPFTL